MMLSPSIDAAVMFPEFVVKAFDISVKDSFMKVVIAVASMVAGICKHNVSRKRLINLGEHMGGLRFLKDRQGVSARA